MAPGSASGGWASAAAALPRDGQAARERPFWQALVRHFGWGRVVDAGCGSGFHLALMRELGVDAAGFDVALLALAGHPGPPVVCGDLLHPPLADGAFDAALCLGNTLSLLPSRAAQQLALAALAHLVRPGGTIVAQGEDAGALVARGSTARVRRVDEKSVHLRVFEPVGRRVRMLAGVVRDGAEGALAESWLLPTAHAAVTRVARRIGLAPAAFPVTPPGGGATWWVAFSVRST